MIITYPSENIQFLKKGENITTVEAEFFHPQINHVIISE